MLSPFIIESKSFPHLHLKFLKKPCDFIVRFLFPKKRIFPPKFPAPNCCWSSEVFMQDTMSISKSNKSSQVHVWWIFFGGWITSQDGSTDTWWSDHLYKPWVVPPFGRRPTTPGIGDNNDHHGPIKHLQVLGWSSKCGGILNEMGCVKCMNIVEPSAWVFRNTELNSRWV